MARSSERDRVPITWAVRLRTLRPRRSSWRALFACIALLLPLTASSPAAAEEVRPIHFPVEGPVRYSNDFGAPRSGHTHQGIDIMGKKLQRLLAACTCRVLRAVNNGVGLPNGGVTIVLKDSAGWEYWYIHMNNDSPGTDDNTSPAEWAFAPGVVPGATVAAGQFVGYMGDSGNAESTTPHLHFEIHRPDGSVINPYQSLQTARTGAPDPRWFLRNSNASGVADFDFVVGSREARMLSCDWDGDKDSTPGWFVDGRFATRSTNTTGEAEAVVRFGDVGDLPVCGDWDGDGDDTVGVFRSGVFYLSQSNATGATDVVMGYGDPGDRPVVGDWNGDGADTVGIFRSGAYYLRNTLTTGVADVTFAYGNPSDVPFVGDWDGDGVDTIGIFRGGSWFLRNSNTTGVADGTFGYGDAGDLPVVGDFDGDGDTTMGVTR